MDWLAGLTEWALTAAIGVNWYDPGVYIPAFESFMGSIACGYILHLLIYFCDLGFVIQKSFIEDRG